VGREESGVDKEKTKYIIEGLSLRDNGTLSRALRKCPSSVGPCLTENWEEPALDLFSPCLQFYKLGMLIIPTMKCS
jgi:hypothetical protein